MEGDGNMRYGNDTELCMVTETPCGETRRTLAEITRANAEMTADLIVRAERLLRFLVGKDPKVMEPKKNAECMYEDADMLSDSLSMLAKEFSELEAILGV